MRLLVCFECNSIEELPDYDGPHEHDVLLEELVSRHGPEEDRHRGTLMQVEDKHWQSKKTRKGIIQQIWKGAKGLDDLDEDYYATKNTFVEDAAKCYNRHNRPKDGCIDYKVHNKRIGNPLKGSPMKVFVCDFCVVKSTVQEKVYKERGLYE